MLHLRENSNYSYGSITEPEDIKDPLKIIAALNTKSYERVFQRKNTLRKKPLLWINNPQYYFTKSELKEDDRINSSNINVFITGCNTESANVLAKNNFNILKTAREAVLKMETDHFAKKSIKELINSGSKKGFVTEVEYSLENKIKLEKFKPECAHGKEPQLKYFFNDQFLPDTRLFVFREKSGNWAGAILTAKINNSHARTDLLLRRNNAPKGTMELLIYSIFNKLKYEGIRSWSLGDVPYIVYDNKIFSKEFLINFTGRRLRYAYNYIGLYNFKNKFNPVWYDTYICTNSSATLLSLLEIAWISNLLKLIFYKIKALPIKLITCL